MATITDLNPNDSGTTSRVVINDNFDALNAEIGTHLANTSNPHSVTKSQVGLGNADNTSDANKPVSTATQTALGLKLDSAKIQRIYKSADETVNNSNSLQDDDALVLPVLANEVWAFHAIIRLTSGATPDIKFKFTVPAGTTMSWGDDDAINVELVESDTKVFTLGSASNRIVGFQGVIFVSATAGNVTLQWAQNTADASDTKILKGSCIIAHRLA